MPRTLDPILQAGLENNAGSPIIRVHIARNDAGTFTSNEVLYYKLSNLKVEIKLAPFEFSMAAGFSYVQIERGLLIDGVEYTVFSSWYIVRTIGITSYETTIEAHLFSINNISTPGDVATNTVLAAIITQTDVAHHTNTISWLANAEWWKTIQFLPTGRQLILDKADHIISLMRQKYLIVMFDIGENKVLPIGASHDSEYPETEEDHFLTYSKCAAFEYNIPWTGTKYYVWRDETGSIHYSGTSTNPLYNLGFIPSTASPTLDGFSNKALFAVLSPPRLDICNGDYCNITLPFDYTAIEMISRVLIDEIFDPRAKFVWRMELQAIEWISNTEAGPLPGTIMQIAAYTPLVTTGFDKNLTPAVNNFQALAEAVDELFVDLPVYANNAAAVAGGLTAGKIYRTGGNPDPICVVH